ncbi:hypothetical protein DSO57_1025373 [Entomophthora muscae]|uniref:Uncharacterized protein n=1 Tax=Entomophthora muscae TaxID=34485 RepID=A0ACC2UN50_9FUNG|nr:hypothetical protein DSO57_1025373 [Entomophthora muscae]
MDTSRLMQGLKRLPCTRETGIRWTRSKKLMNGNPISAGDEFEFSRTLVQVECLDEPASADAAEAEVSHENSTISKDVTRGTVVKPVGGPTNGVNQAESSIEEPKFKIKPLARHVVPRKKVGASYVTKDSSILDRQDNFSSVVQATDSNPGPQTDAHISSLESHTIKTISTLARSKFIVPKRTSGAVVNANNSKPTVDFFFFSSEAVFRSSQGYGDLPIKFNSVEAYQNYHIQVLEEYIQCTLSDLYQKVKSRVTSQGEYARKYSASKATEFRLFSKGEVKVFNSGGFFSGYSKGRNIGAKDEEVSVSSKCDSVQLVLKCGFKSSDFSKDDVWILSTKQSFPLEETVILRSLYHGASGGKIHGHALTKRDSQTLPKLLRQFSSTEPVVLRGINIGTELTMMDNLRQLHAPSPLIDYLIDPTKSPCYEASDSEIGSDEEDESDMFKLIRNMSPEDLDGFSRFVQDLVLKMKTKHSLNVDQEKSLSDFATQFFSPAKPTLLIHGVFGSGKSHLIAVMILFVTQLATYFGKDLQPPKVLVASMTNTAVDNILQLLLKKGFDSFVRVGSLKRIQRSILPYSVQTKSKVEDDIRELRSLLDEDLSDSEVQLIDATIQRFQSADPKQSAGAILQRAPVVGATCLASCFPCLEELTFSVVILDEVSQLTEQMSMLPILKFRARSVVLVGDPLQLPPTIPSADQNLPLQKKLKFTLFDRLMKASVTPVMLKTQYRCHPCISNISNKLFYDSKLNDGIAPTDRMPCLEGLPTLCFINVASGKEKRQIGKQSFHNEDETRVISDLIQGLFQSNIPLSEIGVISMYKLQVEKLEHELASRSLASLKKRQGVRISTVDAFQGAEMEVMIVSCVRSNFSATQFFNSQHRINVALTRGRRHLFLVGNAELLKKYSFWRDIIDKHCKAIPNAYMGSDEFLSLLNVCPSAPKPSSPTKRRNVAPKTKLTGLSAPFRPPKKSKPSSSNEPGRPKKEHSPLLIDDATCPSPDPSPPLEYKRPLVSYEASTEPIDPKLSERILDDSFEDFLMTFNPIQRTVDEEIWDQEGCFTSQSSLQYENMEVSGDLSQAEPDFSTLFQRLNDE